MTTRSIYQPQLQTSCLFNSASSKQHILAKYWIESILEHRLPFDDLYLSLRDGYFLCKLIHSLQPTTEENNDDFDIDKHPPTERVDHFLILAKRFGLQSSDLFDANDLLLNNNINHVVSTILILAHTYSCKKYQISTPLPKRSQSYTFELSQQLTPTRSVSMTAPLKRNDSLVNHYTHKPLPILAAKSKWDPPHDIKRPSCVPAYGEYSIDTLPSPIQSIFEEDFNTKKSHTSGDSGYVTTDNTKDLFDALFAPTSAPTTNDTLILKSHPNYTDNSIHPVTNQRHSTTYNKNTHNNSTKKLSKIFNSSLSKKKKEEPHFVKYQTWSTTHQDKNSLPTPVSSLRRPDEAILYQNQPIETDATKLLLPETISIVEERKPKSRRRTDVSLSKIVTPLEHIRCGSTDQIKSTIIPSTPLDVSNILNHFQNDQLTARYKLGNVIGKGHFGVVYRALDLMSGKTFAIKQINLNDARKIDIDDMMQEANLLSSMTHENIVKYQGFIQTTEFMNIILEFVENGSLLTTLKAFGNQLPENLVSGYCQHILNGLAYLHAQSVVHCDLKAANILTTKLGHVKLSDFGVSLNLKLKNTENLVSGSPYWMSPEVIELKGASVQSDIWSLGCTIIELCTGKPPYADLITMTAMFKIVEDDCPPLPENISVELRDFLILCFKKNPEERPTSKELLNHPWILQSIIEEDVEEQELKTNNTILNDYYLRKTTQKEDMIMPSLLFPLPPPIQTNKHQSLFLNKLNPRQSMPALHIDSHVHNLIECSFPKGAGQCKVCQLTIKHDALVCKDFCGYICHKQCQENSQYRRTRRASDQKNTPITGPKPISSVSSQLREKFNFSRLLSKSSQLHQKELDHILEHSPPVALKSKSSSSWWKKK